MPHVAVRRRRTRTLVGRFAHAAGLLRLLALVALVLWPESAAEPRQVDTGDGSLTALDGDTLRLPDGRRVRLPGVDTPETGRPFAAAARALSAAFVGGRPWQLVPADPGLDRYGRLLADVQVDGQSLSLALVSAGLAWVYESPDPLLLQAQVQAVSQRRGLHDTDAALLDGPLRKARRRFHHSACRLVGADPTRWPLSWNPGGLFKEGLSPCRRCLPWPPAGADT